MFKRLNSALLITGMSILVLANGELQAAESNGKANYKNAICTARETIWEAITSGKGSGASVAIMDQGKIVYSEGIGAANRSENRPVDMNTRFNIGSTSKMFVAAAILMLVDEGKVALDENVAKYIPEFKMKDKRYEDITVRMLFNHSSGLPGTTFFPAYKSGVDPHEILLETLKDANLKHDPGGISIYCNDGFTLAEIIVERVSGKKFLDFLKERIFDPLEMRNTSASVGEIGEENIAERYDPKSSKKYPHETYTVYAAGGLSSTAEDLCRFGNSFTSGGKHLLSETSIKEILKAQPTRFSDKLKNTQMLNAFGWEYSDLVDYREKGIQVVGKGGNTAFYSTNMQILPEEGIVIAACISGNISGEKLTRPILDAVMKDKNFIERPKTVNKPAEPQVIPDELLKYSGYYTDGQKVYRIAVNKEKNAFTIYPVKAKKAAGQESAQSLTLVYSQGFFHNEEHDLKCYFAKVDGKCFLAGSIPPYGLDSLLYQKLDPIREPVRFKTNINGKTWVSRNIPAFIQTSPESALVVISSVYKELPGYVDFEGIKKIEGADFASYAATSFRDQAELKIFQKDGKTWAKTGGALLSMADDIRKTKSGEDTVKIGKDGYYEWLKVEKGVLVSFQKPAEGRVVVSTTDAILFDSLVDAGEVYIPAGSYIGCAGSAGDVFKINAE